MSVHQAEKPGKKQERQEARVTAPVREVTAGEQMGDVGRMWCEGMRQGTSTHHGRTRGCLSGEHQVNMSSTMSFIIAKVTDKIKNMYFIVWQSFRLLLTPADRRYQFGGKHPSPRRPLSSIKRSPAAGKYLFMS